MHNDVNSIIEDKTGKLWFGTRGYASVYDGKTFTTITNKDGKPFANVRSIIKDKKGNQYGRIAGCLIAFACREAFKAGYSKYMVIFCD